MIKFLCCIQNCNREKSIRNFKCLKGNWVIKFGVGHRKICPVHYNKDLELFPRRIFKGNKEKEKEKKKEKEKEKEKEKKCNNDISTLSKDYYPKTRNSIEVDNRKRTERLKRRNRNKKVFTNECCILGCNKFASNREFASLKMEWGVKEYIAPKPKICNYHYEEDSKSFNNNEYGVDQLNVLLVASFFVK